MDSCPGRSLPAPDPDPRGLTRPDSEQTSMNPWINGSMADLTRGLLDTSVLIDLDLIDPDRLPDESAIAAVSLAELAAGPHATQDEEERARRQDRLLDEP